MAEPPATILVIEDDRSLALGLELNLQAEGFRVLIARDGAEGLKLALSGRPDLLILDLMLPGLGGLDLLSELREHTRSTPVIILSARDEVRDKVDGLELGADDYVTKPFSLDELMARVRVALRRGRVSPVDDRLTFGEVEVKLESRSVFHGGIEISLTVKEFDLLAYLIAHPDRVQSREQLLSAVWGFDYEGTARTVDNFIRNLRSKLEADPARPRHLVTVRGAGYRFDSKPR